VGSWWTNRNIGGKNVASKKISPPSIQDDSSSSEDEDFQGEENKMVLVVRNDLNMTKGKIAAQVGHAVLGAYKKGLKKDLPAMKRWSSGGQSKVAVKVNSEEELLAIEKKAKEERILCYVVLDAGRTQIPSGSKTVLAVGPAPRSKVDKVTGQLKLL